MSEKTVTTLTTNLDDTIKEFYLRFAKAADKGIGIRMSAEEVQALRITNMGSIAQEFVDDQN